MISREKLIAPFLCLLVLTGGALFAPSALAEKKSKKEDVSSEKKPQAAAKKTDDAAKKPEEKIALVDINSATKEELMKVPGIGTRYSDDIIKGRPYKAKTQLLSRKILPDAVYKTVSDKIIAKQAK